MSFVILPMGLTQKTANKFFDDAVAYLRDSAMARSIIDELEDLPKVITVKVGPDMVDKYRHPKPDDAVTGGIIEWDPNCSLSVVDRHTSRPKVPWVADAKGGGFCGMFQSSVNANGIISPAVCLVHEMGHAYQFFGDPEGYRAAVRSVAKTHEDNVVSGIENTVVLELRAAGKVEGIRWDYFHTA